MICFREAVISGEERPENFGEELAITGISIVVRIGGGGGGRGEGDQA